MTNDTLRRQIAREAARLMYGRQESQYQAAKVTAARRVSRVPVRPADLPSNREIGVMIASLSSSSADESVTAMPSATSAAIDRFEIYRLLLVPLENVKLDPEVHPEGDALYHSLQVFDLARDWLAYDEEFQLAALLHDVGEGIDRRDPVAAGLEALGGAITPRTVWLIEHCEQANALREGRLGVRSQRRLEAAEDYETLLALCDCDRRGRRKGVSAPELDEAIQLLRDLARSCDEA